MGVDPVLAAVAAAVVLLAAFGVIESRSAQPLVPFGIFRHRSLSVANAVMACVGVSMTASLFFVSLYLQEVLGYSAVRTGLAMVPMTAMLVIGSLFVARRLIPRVGVRSLLVSGWVVAAAGLTWLSRFPDHSAYAAHILGPTVVTGAGMGLMVLPLTVAATGGLDPLFAGLALGPPQHGPPDRRGHRPGCARHRCSRDEQPQPSHFGHRRDRAGLPGRRASLRGGRYGLRPDRPPPAHTSQAGHCRHRC
jgi:hypothetical protein